MSDIQVAGADKVLAGLARLLGGAEAAQRAVLKPLGDRYVAVLQAETPEGEGPNAGRLRQSYDSGDQAYSPTQAHYRIVNKTPYLRWVLSGRPGVHVVSAKALRFVIGGQVIFRRSVGPAKANPFHERAKAAMRGPIDAAGAQIAGLIVRSYGK